MIKDFFSKLEKKSPKTDDKVTTTIENRRNEFLESLKCQINNSVISLAKRITSKEMKIEDLTDKELYELISYYRNKLNIH